MPALGNPVSWDAIKTEKGTRAERLKSCYACMRGTREMHKPKTFSKET